LSIASLLVEAIPYTVKIPVPQGGPEEIAKIGVKEKYEHDLRALEKNVVYALNSCMDMKILSARRLVLSLMNLTCLT
jgi:hypothetical protein